MKRLLLLNLLLFPVFTFAANNLLLNGQKEITINSIPSFVLMTCDLAQSGNVVQGGIYADINENGVFDAIDRNWVWRWGYITDGIGWILDPANPLQAVMGDESRVDGKLRITFPLIRANAMLFPRGTIFVYIVDADGSSDLAKIHLNVPTSAPAIIGKVTEATSGNPLANIGLTAMQTTGDFHVYMGKTDSLGNYAIMVDPGAWTLMMESGEALALHKKPADRNITLSSNQTVTQNYTLQKHTSFVDGVVSRMNVAPAKNIIVRGWGLNTYYAKTDSTGN